MTERCYVSVKSAKMSSHLNLFGRRAFALEKEVLGRFLRNAAIKKQVRMINQSHTDCLEMTSSSSTRKIVNTALAPKPVGPYNQAIVLDNTVYVSGCLGLDKDTMKLVSGGVAAEAKQALKTLGHVLEASGSNLSNVVKTTVFLNDIGDFAAVNEVYKEFFTKDYPARSCFQVGKLPLGALVEIEAIAAVGHVETTSS